MHYNGSGCGEVTVWRSNDYLGMGQHPEALAAMHAAIDRCGTRIIAIIYIDKDDRF